MSSRDSSPPVTASRRALRHATAGAATAALLAGALAAAPGASAAPAPVQPTLSSRASSIITVDGLKFRDLDKNGTLTPYEDWRLTADQRATDLVDRLNLAERAGLLVHAPHLFNGGWDFTKMADEINNKHFSTYLSATSGSVDEHVALTNQAQQIADASTYGIPLLFSSDPRHGFTVTQGQTVDPGELTPFPDAIGFGAIDDPAFTRKSADVMRQEYRALGLQEGLSPQADLVTEPRWSRANGTFGSIPEKVRDQVQAYVEGFQDGSTGLGTQSVSTVVKHWVGYGAQENGYDSHYFYGRYATFPGNNFQAHITPYLGAFDSKVSAIMPTYSILKNLSIDGTPLEQVGAGFNSYLLQNLLRDTYHFDGVVVSDWGILNDCPTVCEALRPPGPFFYTDENGNMAYGMSWGVQDLTKVQRYAKSINAGVDQIGGGYEPEYVVQAVNDGLLSQARVREAAWRVLKQKFQLGLFENPYVDVTASKALIGNAGFKATGLEAQYRSMTLLQNKGSILPVKNTKQKVYLYGVAASAAQAKGFTVVPSPAQADLAIVRLSDPKGGQDVTDLDFKGTEEDYSALKSAAAAGVPTIAVPALTRPLVLTNVVDRTQAVLANYGASDAAVLDVVTGRAAPGGKLPFELPSSMAEVAAQQSDVPNDTAHPLFRVGFGLSYPGTPATLTAGKATVAGKAVVGKKLTAKPGSWTSGTTLSYRWTRGSKAIKGATSATYKVKKADAGKRLSVTVTGTKTGYRSASATSAKTSKVSKAGKVVIKGAAKAGRTLTVKTKGWTPKKGLATVWTVKGKKVSKKPALKVLKKWRGKKVTVKVTVKKKGYTKVSKTAKVKVKK